MILKFHRSMWSFQWFIVLLSYEVSYFPTTIRRWYWKSVGVIPLRDSSSDFHSFKFETDQLHHGRVIDSEINVSKLRQISQTQIWDPGLSSFEIGDGGVKLRPDPIKRSCLLLYLIMGLYLSVWKRATIFGEVGALFFPAMALVYDAIPSNSVFEKETNIQDATSPFAGNIGKRTKDFTAYADLRVTEPQILQERQQLWERRQWILQYQHRESLLQSSNILTSTRRQDPKSYPITSHLNLLTNVMLRAFWSFSGKLIAN